MAKSMNASSFAAVEVNVGALKVDCAVIPTIEAGFQDCRIAQVPEPCLGYLIGVSISANEGRCSLWVAWCKLKRRTSCNRHGAVASRWENI